MFVLFGRASILNQPFPTLGTKPFVPVWDFLPCLVDEDDLQSVKVIRAFANVGQNRPFRANRIRNLYGLYRQVKNSA